MSGEFQPTKEELDRIGEAMKDRNFIELLAEYAKEISDPENRRRNEEEIRQMEAMQGNNVQFINPEPGFVVKTRLWTDEKRKVFINICSSDVVGKPVAKKMTRGGKTGTNWSVPHSLAAHREDLDKSGEPCIVYDAVFHPTTLQLSVADARLRDMVVTTAIEGIEQRFPQHKLRREDLKFPKMKFKGTPARTMLRTAVDGSTASATPQSLSKLRSELEKQQTPRAEIPKPDPPRPSKKDPRAPKYHVIYSNEFDMIEYAERTVPSSRPSSITVKIELPLCSSAKGIELDIAERSLTLDCPSPGPYHLELPLSYPVNDVKATAKFDKSARVLKVTLPVKPDDRAQHQPTAPEVSLIKEVQAQPEAQQELEKQQELESATAPAALGTTTGEEALLQNAPRLPEFTFSQTEQSVTFVCEVPHADPASVKVELLPRSIGPLTVHSVLVDFAAGGDTYHMAIRFDVALKADVSHDASPENVVVVLEKEIPMLLHRFQAGPSEQHLKPFVFPVADTLSSMPADEVSQEVADPWQPSTAEDCKSAVTKLEISSIGDATSVTMRPASPILRKSTNARRDRPASPSKSVHFAKNVTKVSDQDVLEQDDEEAETTEPLGAADGSQSLPLPKSPYPAAALNNEFIFELD
eukprot:m.12037 g.12037  ORF g.12037 m.12037 type:complete len:638 (-) comp3201_c0_seq2:124-2037(-)